MRHDKRTPDQMRSIKIETGVLPHAEGSAMINFGRTQVLCAASVVQGVPRFLKGSGQAWLTAEYGMLPRATNDRTQREAARGKQTGRTVEIQRLIGRSLRSAVDLCFLPEYTITIDCDVIVADGGTRTASISGACVALAQALSSFKSKGLIKPHIKIPHPLRNLIAAVSVGIVNGQPVLDLDYIEDSDAETDMNIIMNEAGGFVEVQGTAEQAPFSQDELNAMLALGQTGVTALFEAQKEALNIKTVKDLVW